MSENPIRNTIDRLMGRIKPASQEEIEAYEKKLQDLKARRLKEFAVDMLNRSGIPKRHFEFAPSRAGEWGERLTVLEAKLGTGMFVALIGVRGNGKTQMACELMKVHADNGKTVKFTTATQFFMEIKATWKKDAVDTEKDVVALHIKPSLLVIDEIGRRGESDWENNLLFELLNRRYNDKKDTIIIGNLSPQELQSNIGESLVSRFNETGGAIQCTWASFRK